MSRYDRAWTEEEKDRLMKVYRQVSAVMKFGIWPEVAKQMPGRSAHQCNGKVRYLRTGPRGPKYLPSESERERVSRDARKAIPASVIADAHQRSFLSHRTLTAAFCGDPLPGRSALDRMNQPRHVRPAITLAGPRL